MTYDEILALIDEEGEFLVQYFDSRPKVHSAIRAVVGLHRLTTNIVLGDICGECEVEYPCSTITVIEKELG